MALLDGGAAEEVDGSAKERFEFVGNGDEMESGCLLRLELDKKVNVAVGSKIVPKRRAEHGKTGDAVGAAEIGEAILRNYQVRVHERHPVQSGGEVTRRFYQGPVKTGNGAVRKSAGKSPSLDVNSFSQPTCTSGNMHGTKTHHCDSKKNSLTSSPP